MIKQAKKIILLFCLIIFLGLPQIILASNNPPLDRLDEVASGDKGPYQTPPVDSRTELLNIVGTVVGIGLGLIGVIFLGLMLYAGYNWMTAQGEEEKVNKAKSIIIESIIGIVIVVGAYASWKYLFSRLF